MVDHDDIPSVEDIDDGEHHCRCRHNTADPERGCECGYADYVSERDER